MTSKGIHHITAIASDAAETVHFYSQILGLRLVKKTVNQDDVTAYHLFFGDKVGHPGMDLTFFIFQPVMQGKRGTGLVSTISLEVPEKSLPFWQKRFEQYNVTHEAIHTQFGYERITFYDKDNQKLELVAAAQGVPGENQWHTDEVPLEQAIRQFHSATLSVETLAAIEPVLTDVFGYVKVSTEQNLHLYEVPDSSRASMIVVSEEPDEMQGFNAAGTVHHIAFRAKDDHEELDLRQRVKYLGLFPTEVINRFYFKSVYFRTPAGILFEIATDGPGFTADESADTLGEALSLPPFLEDRRGEIEAGLPPLVLP